MPAPRQSTALSSLLLRPFLRTTPRSSLRLTSQRFASSDYGSGEGDPVGENPQAAGPSPSSNLEHPGPPPPDVGQGSGSTPTKGTSEGHNTSTPSSGSSISEGESSGSHAGSNSGTQGAQPKILNESPPSDADASEDVKQHNKEFENRAEKGDFKAKGEDGEKDKVGKGFWSGHGGADREP